MGQSHRRFLVVPMKDNVICHWRPHFMGILFGRRFFLLVKAVVHIVNAFVVDAIGMEEEHFIISTRSTEL